MPLTRELRRRPERCRCSRKKLPHPLPYRHHHHRRCSHRSRCTPLRTGTSPSAGSLRRSPGTSTGGSTESSDAQCSGEYSYLLHQIRGGHTEQLAEGCWQVTLPDRRRTLMIRATSWRLITILPKGWQPPGPPPVTVGASSPPYADPAAAAAVSVASSPR